MPFLFQILPPGVQAFISLICCCRILFLLQILTTDVQVPIAFKLFFLSFLFLFATGCTSLNTPNRLPQNITFLTFSFFFCKFWQRMFKYPLRLQIFSLSFFEILPSGVQASINLLNCLPGKMNLGKDIFCCYLLFLLFLGRRDWLEGDFFLSFLLFTFFFLKKGNELVFAKDSPLTGQEPARFPDPLAFASKSKGVGELGAGLH